MTTQGSEAFITRMKLRELRAQREQLRNAYAALAMNGDDEPEHSASIPRLYDGLRALTFAGRPFHPEVANLDLVLHDLAAGRAAPQTVAFWQTYLQRDQARGQLRADTVFLFGSVLEEWAARRTQLPASAHQASVTATLTARAQQPPSPAPWHELLDTLVHALGYQDTTLVARMAELVDEHVGARVEPDEVRSVLEQLRAEPSRTAALRAEAARVVESDLLLREFADALTILIDQRATWTWPTDGVEAQAGWSRTKWRLFLHCGLTLNRAKCGAVCLGGEVPEALPKGPVTWQMLELGNDGQWQVHQPALEVFLAHARWRTAQATAVLSKVEVYNQQLTTLVGQLALTAPLGPGHRASVDAALARYRAEVFGTGQPAEEALRELLRTRFLEPAATLDVPEGWLAWPITAGGLGLTQPTVLAQPYAAALAQRKRITPPERRTSTWQRKVNGWSTFYAAHLEEVEPVTPVEQPVMEALVSDFIARGDELTSGAQHGLSTYWRWVLYTYGPQIIERLGTFRFLETALVPQQLIVQRHLGDTEASVLLADAPAD